MNAAHSFPSDCVLTSPASNDAGQLTASDRRCVTEFPLQRRFQNFPVSAAGTSPEELQRRLVVADTDGSADVGVVDDLRTPAVGVSVGVVADGDLSGELVDAEHAEKFSRVGAITDEPHEHGQQRPSSATTTTATSVSVG